ncbi:tyrosine-type recombinase/integrase [Lactobacillus ruminis]|nr:tyrosine-type recombinase/integrase [Ligilactobacillus ruminis]
MYKKYPQKKITLHGFRHTHASLLFQAGATIKEVQTRLGHSSSKTTLDIYTHVTQSKKQEVAQKFANYIDL